MPQSLAAIYVHLIYSTKNRQPLIRPDIEEELRRYHTGILRAPDSPMICSDGAADAHRTPFCGVWAEISIAEVVEELKKSSTKWIKTKGPEFSDFYWQSGYGAFPSANPDREPHAVYRQSKRTPPPRDVSRGIPRLPRKI